MRIKHLRRREFITLLGGAAATWPLAARAQTNRVRKIGVLLGGSENDAEMRAEVFALQKGLQELGHRTGHEDFPHPALGQDFTPSPTARRAQAGTGARARSTRKGARVDTSRPCVA